MKCDVFIPTVFKDLNKLDYVIRQLCANCDDIADFHISMPDCQGKTVEEISGHKVVFHNDFDILPSAAKWMKLAMFRPNWILQQLLKLLQRVTSTEYYYVIDSDIIPVSKLSLFKDGKPVLFSRLNMNDASAFIRFIAKATGGDLVTWTHQKSYHSLFIPDMQLFKTAWVDEMISQYFWCIEDFIRFAFMNAFSYRTDIPEFDRTNIFISEYIMYSLYVEKYHEDEVSVVLADTKQIDRNQQSQNEHVFGEDEINREIASATAENRMFLKLQSNCGTSDIKYAVRR